MVLAGVLFMSIVTVMFISAAVQLSPGSLASSRNLEHSLAALRAAQAGVEYARCRMRTEVTWRGGEGGPTATINTPECVVVENEGNVVGILRTDVGEWSQFRIRFNFQNGNNSEGRPDPQSEYVLEIPHVSMTNLSSTAPLDLPCPVAAPYAVLPSTPKPYKVPPYSVCLKVEGRAGAGLRDLNELNVNGASIPGRPVVTRVVEAFIKADNSDTMNAAAMAGGEMTMDLPPTSEGKLELKTNDRKVPPRTRSKGATTLTGGDPAENLVSRKGEMKTVDGELPGATYRAGDITPGTENSGDPFYQLQWDDVKKADPDPATTEAVHIKAGTYVWKNDGKLHYYDMDFDAYKTFMATTLPGTPGYDGVELSQNLSQVRLNMGTKPDSGGMLIQANGNSSSGTLTLREDVCVKATGNASGFTMIPQSGAAEGPPNLLGEVTGAINGLTGSLLAPVTGRITGSIEPEDVKLDFKPGKRCTFSADGDIFLGAKVEGQNGSITTAGNLKLVGGGDLAAPLVGLEEVGVNMYARGDITLNSYDEKNGSNSRYKDFKLAGVIYTWGNFTFEGGARPGGFLSGYALGEQGKLDLTGALVAYGRDPSLGLPSSVGGKGRVDMRGRHVKLTYDSAYIGGLKQSLGVGGLRISSWSEK